MIRISCLLSIVVCAVLSSPSPAGQSILLSEIRVDEPSTDNNEFFELRGTPGASLDGITYLVIGEYPPTSTGSGGIEEAIDLSGNSIPSDGYFLVAEASFSGVNGFGTTLGITPDLTTSFNFENEDNVTHLIVQGFNGTRGDDFDTDNDGNVDLNIPWIDNMNILDAVGFVGDETPPTQTEFAYGAALGFEDIGPDSSAPTTSDVPFILFRDETQSDVWQIGESSLADPNTIDDTPGTRNVGTSPEPCDFDNNTFCNLADINMLLAQGNLVTGVSGGAPFDLVVDGTLNQSDVTEWLSAAATHNGYDTPYLRGDTDDVGATSSDIRDVDITDFNALGSNFNPNGMDDMLGNWDQGNFDGDGDIDITDFNSLASNFSPGGYGLGDGEQAVPEPAGASLVSIALVLLATWGLSHRMR